jgi:uncharacterized membrane protein YccC
MTRDEREELKAKAGREAEPYVWGVFIRMSPQSILSLIADLEAAEKRAVANAHTSTRLAAEVVQSDMRLEAAEKRAETAEAERDRLREALEHYAKTRAYGEVARDALQRIADDKPDNRIESGADQASRLQAMADEALRRKAP